MISSSLDEITIDDLQRLVEDRVSEGKTIEYKRELNLNDIDHKRTLFSEVVSFANARGGDLVLGVDDDEDGVAVDISGMDVDSVDETRGQITHLLRQKVEPPIPPGLLEIKHLDLDNSRTVFIIRVRESWRSPHRELINRQFYGRSSHGKEPLDVDEIRQHVLLSETNAEQIREFRTDRIARIQAGRTPVPVEEGPKVVLHVVPFNAFTPGTQIDIQAASIRQENAPRLLRSTAKGSHERFTADGLVTYWSSLPDSQRSYTLTFRSGVIEAVSGKHFRSDTEDMPFITGGVLRSSLEFSLDRYCGFLDTQDVAPPVFAFLSLIDAEDYGIKKTSESPWPPDYAIGESVALLPEQVIEDFDDLDPVVDSLMDFVWNAGGYSEEQ